MSMRYPGGVISATADTPSSTSASGVWNLEDQMQAQAAGNWPAPFTVSNSLRFRASASANITRTFASNGTRTTWTWSGWVKRGALGSNQCILGGGTSGSNYFTMWFTSGDIIQINEYQGANNVDLQTTQVFRDPSGWYHIVLVYDTTQSTSSNRVKLYVNGSQVTALSTATYPSQNFTSLINSTTTNYMARINSSYSSYYLDGYLAEVNFVDGSALTPSSFGTTDPTTGVWTYQKYSGSYGTNGYYLSFSDTSALTTSSNAGLGKDFSGNGNYWTTNNISITAGATYDAMTDVPAPLSSTVGNYATLNPLFVSGSNGSTSDANLTTVGGSNPCKVFPSTIAVKNGGKFYAEYKVVGSGNYIQIGVSDIGLYNYSSGGAWGSGLITFDVNQISSNYYINSTSNTPVAVTAVANDILMVAFDSTTRKVWFGKNGTWNGSGDPAAGTNEVGTLDGTNAMMFFCRAQSTTLNANFGQQPWAYTIPSGFKALNTYNLPTPSIGASATTLASSYFSPTIYNGNGTSQTITNGINLSGNGGLVWLKSRNNPANNVLTDTVRGVDNLLYSDSAAAQANGTWGTHSFNTTGFGITGADGANNGVGITYVSWSVQKATNVFDIVTWTGNGTMPRTIYHNLGSVPDFIAVKCTSNSSTNWLCFVRKSDGNTQKLRLNGTMVDYNTVCSQGDIVGVDFTDRFGVDYGSTGDITGVNQNGYTYVAYLFASNPGFSYIGSYTGNGSSDGQFVYTGFRPAYVMVKATSAAEPWKIWDSARGPYNTDKAVLWANLTNAEVADGTQNIDLLSNGFKFRMTDYGNTNGVSYIYIAFAENPFKYALAR